MLTIKKPEKNVERRIITSMIVSRSFMHSFRSICKTELFQSMWTRTVADWCVQYYDQYEDVPKQSIQSVYESQKERLDETMGDLISDFLFSISEEYKREDQYNYQFALDEAEKYMKKLCLKSLIKNIEGLLLNGDIKKAESIISSFYNVSREKGIGFDLMNDFDKIKEILANREKHELFRFKGCIGRVVDVNCRGQLIAFLAPEKRGKSWWLQETALTALMKGYNVAFFSFEMTEDELLLRFVQSLTGRPFFKKDLQCPIPYLEQKGKNAVVKYRRSRKPQLYTKDIVAKLGKLKAFTRGAGFQVLCAPSDSHTLNDVKYQLEVWNHEKDFIPDVIVIDYADLMAPINNHLEYRHQLDSIWKGLKRLAQEKHCLVATASQAKAESHTKRVKKDSVAEDKRKASHCDRMIALNQTEEEKRRNLMRLNVLFERHNSSQDWKEIVVLQQLAIGKPYLGSFIKEKKESDK